MADGNDQDDQITDVDNTEDREAERLLADAVDDDTSSTEGGGKQARETETDTTDWKAEAEKWKRLSRKNEATAKSAGEKLREYEDANKTESQRLQEERDANRSRAELAETKLKKREIAEARAPEHATVKQIAAVAKRLSGESDEDLEVDADELFALLAPKPADPPARVPGRPAERMPRGGGDPDEPPEETDPRKLADLIPRGRR